MLEIVSSSIFYEIAALLIIAAVLGIAGLLIRLPLIVSFLLVGVIAGPSILGLVGASEHIELLAELGITILLFLVGLKLDLGMIRTLGAVALVAGLGQIALTAGLGFGLCLWLGFDVGTSLYLAGALTFSSTIIIVKLLSDKREIDSLHGRIAIGVLIVQDLAVVLAMVLLSALTGARDVAGPDVSEMAVGSDLIQVATIVAEGALIVGAVWLFIRYGATRLLALLGRSPELLIAFAIGWAALLASLLDHFGFSKELGGLIAGVSLASTPYRESIAARLAPLRDFLLLFFFIALGAKLDLGQLGGQIGAAVVLSLFVLIGKPLIVMAIVGLMGYRRRTGFLAGAALGQISEFSLIFIAMGVALGHVGPEVMSLTTLIGLATIGLSSYLVLSSQGIYRWLEPALGLFERRSKATEEIEARAAAERDVDVILFGLGRYGGDIWRGLRQRGFSVLGVDFDPAAVRHWQAQGLPACYGDAGDPDFAESLPLDRARWVVCAVPQQQQGLVHDNAKFTLLHAVRRHGFAGKVALAAHDAHEAMEMHRQGVDVILMPFVDAARQAVEAVVEADEGTGETPSSKAAAEIILVDGERSESC
jgi:Kef-type K+ transport system membrane component KefB